MVKVVRLLILYLLFDFYAYKKNQVILGKLFFLEKGTKTKKKLAEHTQEDGP